MTRRPQPFGHRPARRSLTTRLDEVTGRLAVIGAVLESRAAVFTVEVGDEQATPLTLAGAPDGDGSRWN